MKELIDIYNYVAIRDQEDNAKRLLDNLEKNLPPFRKTSWKRSHPGRVKKHRNKKIIGNSLQTIQNNL